MDYSFFDFLLFVFVGNEMDAGEVLDIVDKVLENHIIPYIVYGVDMTCHCYIVFLDIDQFSVDIQSSKLLQSIYLFWYIHLNKRNFCQKFMFQIESLGNNVGRSSHYRIRVIRHRID